MMSISRPVIITIIFMAVAILALGSVVQYQDLSIIKKELDVANTRLEYKDQEVAHLEDLSKELDKYEDQLKVIDQALSWKPSVPSLFDFIQRTASENGVVLQNITSEGVIEGTGNMREIQVDLSVIGLYPQFKSFLSALHKSNRLIEVENVSFASSFFSPEGGLLSFSLTIKTHFY